MCILFFFTYIYVLLLTRLHHVHVSLLFLFISSYVCNDLSVIKNMFCSVLFILNYRKSLFILSYLKSCDVAWLSVMRPTYIGM